MFATTVTTLTRRWPLALAALALLAAALWAPTQAGAQQAPPTPVAGTLTFAAGEVCPFAIQIDFEGKGSVLQLPNGTRIATISTSPTLTATVTNLATGEEVDLNIPGPTQVLATGETVFLGPALVIRSPEFGDNTTALVYVSGRYTFLPGRTPPFSGTGQLVDVCALLA
jgi:hypothetical protein